MWISAAFLSCSSWRLLWSSGSLSSLTLTLLSPGLPPPLPLPLLSSDLSLHSVFVLLQKGLKLRLIPAKKNKKNKNLSNAWIKLLNWANSCKAAVICLHRLHNGNPKAEWTSNTKVIYERVMFCHSSYKEFCSFFVNAKWHLTSVSS